MIEKMIQIFEVILEFRGVRISETTLSANRLIVIPVFSRL